MSADATTEVDETLPEDAVDDVESTEPLEDDFEEPLAEEVEEPAEAEDERAIAPVSERSVTSTSARGVYVPDWMLRSSWTRGLAESYIELRKVTWPEPRDAWNMSLVVIAVSVVMSLLLAGADFGLGHLLSYFVSLGLGK